MGPMKNVPEQPDENVELLTCHGTYGNIHKNPDDDVGALFELQDLWKHT